MEAASLEDGRSTTLRVKSLGSAFGIVLRKDHEEADKNLLKC